MGKHDQESAAVGARRATGAATGRGRGGRFSAGRKRETVLRLLRGEDLESVSRELGITAARALRWRDRVSGCGPGGAERASLQRRMHRDDDHRRLQAKIGEPADGSGPSDCTRRWTTWRPAPLWPGGGRRGMSGAQSISTRRAYGVQRICRAVGQRWTSGRSVYARRHATKSNRAPYRHVAQRAGRRCRPRSTNGASRPRPPRRALKPRRFMAKPRVPQSSTWAKLRVAGIRHLEGTGACGS